MRLKAKLKFIERLKELIKQKVKLWNRKNILVKFQLNLDLKLVLPLEIIIPVGGTLKIETEIKPTILFHMSENGEKHNLIEQIATDKVKELIKTSGSNIVDVEIHSVILL